MSIKKYKQKNYYLRRLLRSRLPVGRPRPLSAHLHRDTEANKTCPLVSCASSPAVCGRTGVATPVTLASRRRYRNSRRNQVLTDWPGAGIVCLHSNGTECRDYGRRSVRAPPEARLRRGERRVPGWPMLVSPLLKRVLAGKGGERFGGGRDARGISDDEVIKRRPLQHRGLTCHGNHRRRQGATVLSNAADLS